MTIEDLEEGLPWGFHDSYIERLSVDWLRGQLVIDLLIAMSEAQDLDQRAQLVVDGLCYLVVEPPRRIPPDPGHALWVDSIAISDPSTRTTVPAPAAGCFLHEFHVYDWGSSIYVCARNARLIWQEDRPSPARQQTRALFPNDTIADPK